MTSRERVLAALERKPVDRVPHLEWRLDDGIVDAIAPGASYEDFVETTCLDGIVIAPDYSREFLDNHTWIDEWGVTRKNLGNEGASVPVGGPIRHTDNLRRYHPPDPGAEHRFSSLRRAVRRFKDKKTVIIWLNDVFSIPRNLRTCQGILLDLYQNPALVKKLVALSVELNSELAFRAARLGADIVVAGDDLADNRGPLMSPLQFREFFSPAMAEVVRSFHRAGLPAVKHTDGNIDPIIENILSAGWDGLDPIDEMAGLNIFTYKKRYGDRICLKGGLDCVRLLTEGTPEDVRRRAELCVRELQPGFILSSTNTIHSGVKPANYRAVLATVESRS